MLQTRPRAGESTAVLPESLSATAERSLWSRLAEWADVAAAPALVAFVVAVLLLLDARYSWLAPLAAVALWLRQRRMRLPALPGPLRSALILLVAGSVVGVVPSVDTGASWMKWCAVITGVLLVPLISRLRPRQMAMVVGELLLFGVIFGFAADVQVDRNSWKLNGFNRAVYTWFQHIPRFSDVALNQNAAAAVLIVLIPFAVVLTLRPFGKWARIVAGVTLGFLVFQLALTNSRAAILSLGLGLGTLAVLRGGRWARIAAAFPLGAVAILLSGVLGVGFQLTFSPTGGSSLERWDIWSSALNMLADAPFTGIGLGGFQHVYPLYIAPTDYVDYPHAHNLFLQAAVDQGLLGLLGMLLLVGVALALVVRLKIRPPEDGLVRGLGQAAASATVAMLAHAQVDCYFAGDSRAYFLMFIPLGMLAGCAGPSRLARRWKQAGLVVATLAAGLLVWQWRAVAAEAWTNAGTIQRLKSQLAAQPAGRVALDSKASADFRRALAIDGLNWPAKRGLGLLAFDDGRDGDAMSLLSASVGHGFDDRSTRLLIGEAALRLGDRARAVDEWRRAEAAPYLVRAGEADARLGRPATAEQDYQLALRVNPYDTAAYDHLAALYALQGRWEQVKSTLEEELRKAPDYSLANARLGMVAFWREGEVVRGLQLLSRAVNSSAGNDGMLRAEAEMFAAAGMHDEAKLAFARADRMLSTTGRPSDTLGQLYQFLGLRDRAALEFARIAYGVPADPIGHLRLGEVLLSEGKFDQAIAELRRAVAAIPNQEGFRLALARAYVRAGQPAAATRQYRAVLALDPGSAEAREAVNSDGNR